MTKSNSQTPSLLNRPLAERGLIAFIMAGDPDPQTALRVALALIDEGVVALEIGVPFSDPVADGPVIQASAARALKGGATLKSTFDFVTQIKKHRPAIPIVLFTYLNPILKLGLEAFTQEALSARVDATLVVDLPPEESVEHILAHRKAGLGTIFLASPTTRPDRLRKILSDSTGFVYAISRAGTTGAHVELAQNLQAQVNELREIRNQVADSPSSRLPIAVGFGISTPEQAGQVAKFADAVIIGSRIVSLIHESANADEAETRVRQFTRDCVAAIRKNGAIL